MPSNTSNSPQIMGYITKILNSLDAADIGITLEARKMIDRCISTFSKRLLIYSNELSLTNQRKTLEIKDLRDSLEIWLLKFPKYREMLHISAEAAATNYFNAVENINSSSENIESVKLTEPKESKQKKAGIVLPVTRLGHYLKNLTIKKNISLKANIYFTGLLNCLCEILCSKAIKISKKFNKKRITHAHISHSIQLNDFLSFIFKGCIMGGGIPLD